VIVLTCGVLSVWLARKFKIASRRAEFGFSCFSVTLLRVIGHLPFSLTHFSISLRSNEWPLTYKENDVSYKKVYGT
jgi:hypothetical protein